MRNFFLAAVIIITCIDSAAQHIIIKQGTTVSAGNIIRVKDHFINDGNFLQKKDPLILDGNFHQLSGSTLVFRNLQINCDSVKLSSALILSDSLYLKAGILVLNDHQFKFSGFLSGNGLIKGSDNSELIIDGNGDAGIFYFDTTVKGRSNSIGILSINRTGNGNVVLGNQLSIKEQFDPINGKITSNGLLTLTSSDSLTASVSNASNFEFTGDVNVERFIPAKTERKWTFVSSAVNNVTIKSGWQDEIFVTGQGTGGSTCNLQHSNGFDASGANSPSMYIYDQTNSVRWQSVAGTLNTYLQAGKGYRLLVRGNRNVVNACADQLASTNPPAPVAVTLVASGTLTKGDVTVTVHGGAKGYTLLGNPYASEIDFSSVYTDNAAVINNKYWSYDPASSGTNYLTYSDGIVAGCPSNIITGNTESGDGNAHFIASGQGFFVESRLATHSAITFKELHKTSEKQRGVFKSAFWKDRIRTILKKATGAYLDDIVVRFSNDPAVTMAENMFDAITLNSANLVASLKTTKSYAIQTRPKTFSNDTVKLRIAVSTIGNYRFQFTEFAILATSTDLFLLDLYSGVTTDITQQSSYDFSVTNDPVTQGTGRFILLFKAKPVLPLEWITAHAGRDQNNIIVKWQTGSEQDVVRYQVWKSTDGISFSVTGSVNNNHTGSYEFIDNNGSGAAYYYISVITRGKSKLVSKIIFVKAIPYHLLVYPNPAKDKITIHLPSDRISSLLLTNAEGKKLLHKNYSGVSKDELDVSHLVKGVYFIVVNINDGDVFRGSFIKI